MIIERDMISVKRHVISYGYDEYICAYFDLLKGVSVVHTHVAAIIEDKDQGSDKKPVTNLNT